MVETVFQKSIVFCVNFTFENFWWTLIAHADAFPKKAQKMRNEKLIMITYVFLTIENDRFEKKLLRSS